MGQPCGKASWESLLRKPRVKATDFFIHAKGSMTLLLQLGRKAHVHATTRDEGRLQKYPKIRVSTGQESSGSGTDSTQGLMPGSSLGGSREFEGWTALAWKDLFIY